MDESVLGTPFYVMEYLEGRIFTDVRLPEIKSHQERVAWFVFLSLSFLRICTRNGSANEKSSWKSIVKVLAGLHRLDPKALGLQDFGSTKPFYPRQIKLVPHVSSPTDVLDLSPKSRKPKLWSRI